MEHTNGEKGYQRHAWLILFILEILLLLNLLFVIAVAEGPDNFQADTDVSWVEFSQTYPSVATAYLLEQRGFLSVYVGLTLLALIVTFFAFREGNRWAWYALWIFPATVTLTAVLFALSEEPDLAAYYGIYAVVVVVVLLLPIRRFFPAN